MATLQQLKFRQRIIPEGRKAIPVSELVKRLKTLHTELAEMDQEAINVHSLDRVTEDLLSPSLCTHKDNGVRIHTACCIADLMRLYAPEAPYDEGQLRRIFEFFLSQLGRLGQTDDPLFPLYFYLLESLSTVKSVVLVVDLAQPEELITDFFRLFFDIIQPSQSRNMQLCMVDILIQLVEESTTVPQEVVDILLAQFLKKRQLANPAAYQLACDLCNAATDRLQKYVCQYFTDVIVTASRQGGVQSKAPGEAPGSGQLNDLKTAHYLIKEINRTCPGLLLNVIPQLEEELTLDDVHLRTLATSVLGDMIAERGHALVRRYPTMWQAWLQRKNDKHVQVRALWVTLAVSLYQAQPQLANELNAPVLSKVSDPEERVRQALAYAVAQLNYDTLAFSNLDLEILVQLGHRCRDKKAIPRREAVRTLSHIFRLAFPSIEQHQPRAIQRFGWIPSTFLNTLYVNDPDITVVVYQALFSAVFPPSDQLGDDERTRRLLIVLALLNERASKAFVAFLQRQAVLIRDMRHYLDACENYNTTNVESENPDQPEDQSLSTLMLLIQRIAAKLPDAHKHTNHLFNFAKLHDHRLYKLLRGVMDLGSDYKTIRHAQREATRRFDNLYPALKETFTILLRQIALTVVNRSTVGPLLRVIREGATTVESDLPESDPLSSPIPADSSNMAPTALSQLGTTAADEGDGPASPWSIHKLATVAQQLLTHLSTIHPSLCQSHLDELVTLLQQSQDGDSPTTQDPTLITGGLQTLAHYALAFPTELPLRNPTAVDWLRGLVLRGQPKEAKYAMTVLTRVPQAETHCASLLDTLVTELDASNPNPPLSPVLGQIRALGPLARYLPNVFTQQSEWVVNYLVKRVVLVEPHLETQLDAEWVPLHELDVLTQCKLAALKVLTDRLLGVPSTADPQALAKPVYSLLLRLVNQEGELFPGEKATTGRAQRSHLRLTAAKCLLKLAIQDRYDALLSVAQVEQLGLLVQDPCFQVRFGYLTKLVAHLTQLRIPHRYLPAVFLVAFDPEPDAKATVKTFVKRQLTLPAIQDRFASLYEVMIARLLHLLAHHPDFRPDNNQVLHLFARYVEFYFELVATASNVSLIFYTVTQLKIVADRTAQPQQVDNIYVLSDMAQFLIQEKCQSHQWSLPSYPGTVHPPSDLFAPLTDPDQLTRIAKHSFLPKDFTQQRATTVGQSQVGHSRTKKNVRSKVAVTQRSRKMLSKTQVESGQDTEDEEDNHTNAESDERNGKTTGKATPAKRKRVPGTPTRLSKESTKSSRTTTVPQRRNAPRGTRQTTSTTYRELTSEEEEG
ncbi:Sister chromatid cohesion protein pds5 [Dispira simplex]|nr:Sister chromatid cohesion protein pds5 [Dispira simplex]